MYQLVTSGMLRRRAAIDALQAAARPSAWITSQPRSRASRVKTDALRSMVSGLLPTSSAMNSPPAAVTSAASRPARDTTMARLPADTKMRVKSTAPASAAPPSRLGTTISTLNGGRAAASRGFERSFASEPAARAAGRSSSAGSWGAVAVGIGQDLRG